MELEFSRQIFEKYSNIKFHENCPVAAELLHGDRRTEGRTDGQTDRGTDMTKPIDAFLKTANAPNKEAVILTEKILHLTQSAFRAIDRLYGG